MSQRIESLDSLRGIASLVVVIFHCLLSFNVFYQANYYSEFSNDLVKYFTVTPFHTVWAGNEAVLLFFVLSGFVLSIPFFKGKQLDYTSYIIRRFFRIYVPYIIVMMVSVVLVTLFHEFKSVEGLSPTYENRWDHAVSLKAIVSYVLMLSFDINNVNGAVWTLFHEMKISLIFPLFIFIILKFNFLKGLSYALGINAGLYLLFNVAINFVGDNIISLMLAWFKESLYYCIFFIFGAVLSKYSNNLTILKQSTTLKKGILLLISLILINSQWVKVFLNVDNTKVTDFISVAGILLLFALVIASKKLSDFLTKKPLLWLGKVSFSLYLIHIPILMLTTIFIGKFIPIEMAFVIVPFVCLILANFVYRFVEVPANNLGKKIANFTSAKIERGKIKKVS